MAFWPMKFPSNCCMAGWVVDIIPNCCIMRLCLVLRWALLVATCCINVWKTAVFASFNAVDCVRMDADKFAMWVLMDSTMVPAVPLSDTMSLAVRPAKQLLAV